MDSSYKQLGNLALGDSGLPSIQNHFPPPLTSGYQATAAYHIRRMSFPYQAFSGMSNERLYLLENLQRQHDRGQRLSHALSNVETRLASVQSKGEARKLRKEAGLLKSKIVESNKQEHLIAKRLDDLHREEIYRLYQAQQPGLLPHPYSPHQPWSRVALSPMTPLSPVSPLSPLPPGIYHPSPIPPSPLEPAFILASPCVSYSPTVPYEQSLFSGGEHQGLYAPEQHDAVSPVTAKETRRNSLEHKATGTPENVLSEQENISRRWSLADTYSPSPRNKRMSMPGLQTIWRY